MTFTVKLLDRKPVARETMTFFFSKPEGFVFTPGQHLGWTLINPPETDARGTNRPFTISAAPFEKNLAFTTRLRDTAFKRIIQKMPLGATVEIDGPEGDFVLPLTASSSSLVPIVMLAGGIGITPFRSMIAQTSHDQASYEIYLFWSNHTKSDAPFFEELESLAKTNPRFHLVFTFTKETVPNYESGYIDAKMVKKYLPENANCLYFLAGPPAMVAAMKELLLKDLQVPVPQILTDMFDGY